MTKPEGDGAGIQRLRWLIAAVLLLVVLAVIAIGVEIAGIHVGGNLIAMGLMVVALVCLIASLRAYGAIVEQREASA
jgi:membrane protein YdbS with pleckstrin-like domain